MHKDESKINCEIFQKQQPIIKELTDKINKAKAVKDKAQFADDLQKETDTLLSCSEFREDGTDCATCRFIAQLRKTTANLIIKAKKLA